MATHRELRWIPPAERTPPDFAAFVEVDAPAPAPAPVEVNGGPAERSTPTAPEGPWPTTIPR